MPILLESQYLKIIFILLCFFFRIVFLKLIFFFILFEPSFILILEQNELKEAWKRKKKQLQLCCYNTTFIYSFSFINRIFFSLFWLGFLFAFYFDFFKLCKFVFQVIINNKERNKAEYKQENVGFFFQSKTQNDQVSDKKGASFWNCSLY